MIRFATIGTNFVTGWFLEAARECRELHYAAACSRSGDKARGFAAEHGAKEVHLLPYHRLGEVKYRRLGRTYLFDGRTPDEAELHWAASLIEGYGLPVQIGG